jgi:arylformamidase
MSFPADIKIDAKKIIDITPVITPQMAVFPGDTPFTRDILLDMKKGHNLSLSSIKTTVHIGAHTDAPNHYSKEGESIEKRPLSIYIGSAQVIEVKARMGERITKADLVGKKITAPRVLFKTLSFPNPYKWNNDFMALSAELIEHLHQNGVRLVGIDTPSIDLMTDQVLESHNAVARNDMAILEGIVLNDVNEDEYQLIALPLSIADADATPVRAILLK